MMWCYYLGNAEMFWQNGNKFKNRRDMTSGFVQLHNFIFQQLWHGQPRTGPNRNLSKDALIGL